MPVAEVLDLLRCPLCASEVDSVDGGVRCAAGHRFDVARQGYLNLLGRRPPQHADTAAMVAARERFLALGAYGPVAAGLVAAVRAGLASRNGSAAPTLLEVGAGSGYYTAALAEALGARGVALDISVPAARRAARAHPAVAAVVADAWATLPVPDAVLDLVTCVFAPRNPAEFARVLRPDGLLAVVTPQPDHLQELRDALGLLTVEPDKQDRLAATLSAHFTPRDAIEVRYRASWSASAVTDLVSMGPNAFHTDPDALAGRVARLAEPVTVTVAVTVTTWAHLEGLDGPGVLSPGQDGR